MARRCCPQEVDFIIVPADHQLEDAVVGNICLEIAGGITAVQCLYVEAFLVRHYSTGGRFCSKGVKRCKESHRPTAIKTLR